MFFKLLDRYPNIVIPILSALGGLLVFALLVLGFWLAGTFDGLYEAFHSTPSVLEHQSHPTTQEPAVELPAQTLRRMT